MQYVYAIAIPLLAFLIVRTLAFQRKPVGIGLVDRARMTSSSTTAGIQ
jgi:hypothetical protein